MRIKLEKIICATDFSPNSNHALPYGIALARRFLGKLYVSHTVNLGAAAGLYDSSAYVLTTTRDELVSSASREIRRLMGDQLIAWEPLVLDGEAASETARVAEDLGADLVIVATYGRSGVKRFLLGSVTQRLLQTLSCPLLVVRSPEHEFVSPAAQDIKLRRILVGCDFSPDSELALQHAISLAQEFEAEIHLLHVLEPTLYRELSRSTAVLAGDLERAVESAVEGRLSELVPREKYPWCEVKPAFDSGSPHEGIIKYAKSHDVDLIVLGVRGRNLMEKLFVGSTVDRVLRQAACPVLVVRKSGKTEETKETKGSEKSGK